MNSRQKRLSHFELKRISIENKWSGKGTEDSPYIIESSFESYLEHFTFINSSFFHFIFRNCQFKNIVLHLERCQYLAFENCTFSKEVIIGDSNELLLKDCSFSDKITLTRCHDIKIELCSIIYLELDLSHNNFIKKCRIAKLYNYLSRGNSLENNEIPPIYVKSFIKGSKENRSKWHIIMYLSIYFCVMISLYLILLIARNPVIKFFPLVM
ncbi:MAG: hypothetical protein ACFFG0_11625 [Candidatus Thorarchaeota archaeon]